jgi:hypothetical protein
MQAPVRKKTWLSFDGMMERKEDLAVLRPREDPGCYVVFGLEQVRSLGTQVQVQLGAVAFEIHVAEGSVFARSGGRTHSECGGPTRCFGRLEVCCDGKKVVGNCAGKWGC